MVFLTSGAPSDSSDPCHSIYIVSYISYLMLVVTRHSLSPTDVFLVEKMPSELNRSSKAKSFPEVKDMPTTMTINWLAIAYGGQYP